MPQYIITPWASHSQLLHIRKAFYPERNAKTVREKKELDEAKREAVAMVGVWVKRGNCPHLVESTGMLLAAALGDGVERGRGAWSVRAAYASAFCRFVTGLLDSHQDKRGKRSMYSIAKTLGLPATYVELRHQAIHEELPPLSKLRAATQKALKWIWDYYWVHLPDVASQTDKCKALVQKWVEEKDERGRSRIEQVLRKSDGDHIVNVLMESYDLTEDVDVRLQIVMLHSKLLHGESKEPEALPLTKSLEEVRAELEKIDNELSKVEVERSSTSVSKADVVRQSDSIGWTRWEGPWIPKPIGVV